MNFKLKTLLVLSGAALLAIPGLQAQRAGGGSRGGGFVSAGARPSFAARPSASLSRSGTLRGSRFTNTRPTRDGYYGGRGGSYYRGNGHGHHYGRYYYLGGIPYYYPFYGYGFGYPSYYGSGFYGPYGNAYYGGAYEGRINGRDRDDDDDDDYNGAVASAPANGPSLPSAVQRQLSKRGYYKGKIDGQFGPASREALGRFQKSQDLKATGRIDEDTLGALGFTDEH